MSNNQRAHRGQGRRAGRSRTCTSRRWISRRSPRFENEIDRFWNKKGIIIDIRNNGGGNIDQELLDILERQPYEYWNNRNGSPIWGRRPRQAIAGPKVMMINGAFGESDAEADAIGIPSAGACRTHIVEEIRPRRR